MEGQNDAGAGACRRLRWRDARCSRSGTEQPASVSPSEEPLSPLVGEWKRVTACQELVRLLEANSLGSRAPQAIEGNDWVGGTLEQLAEKDDPCEGAVPREHSHFFTEFDTFGTLDWRGEQVDIGTYVTVDDRTFTIGDATFHVEIRGDTIRFEPVLPDKCTGFDCVWMIPEGMTRGEWLDREERRAIAVTGLGGAGSFLLPTIVGGSAGRLSADCGVVLAVEDRRGYVFRLYGDITVNIDLREVIRSIELHPETL